MQLKMYDTTGAIHFEGENYLSSDDHKGKWFMTDDCNIPRKVINDEVINNTRCVHLSNYPLNKGEKD